MARAEKKRAEVALAITPDVSRRPSADNRHSTRLFPLPIDPLRPLLESLPEHGTGRCRALGEAPDGAGRAGVPVL
jgi:hypothetical protein